MYLFLHCRRLFLCPESHASNDAPKRFPSTFLCIVLSVLFIFADSSNVQKNFSNKLTTQAAAFDKVVHAYINNTCDM